MRGGSVISGAALVNGAETGHIGGMTSIRLDLNITFAELIELLDRFGTGIAILNHLKELKTMSETTDQAIADLTALAQKQQTDSAQLKADVTKLLANLTNSGTLNPSQQAAVDGIKVLMGQADTDTTDTDVAVTSATTPTP